MALTQKKTIETLKREKLIESLFESKAVMLSDKKIMGQSG